MQVVSKAGLGVAAIVGVLAFGTSAHAYLSSFTVDANAKCRAAKIKTVGKAAAAYAGCYSKAASKGLATDPACITKASGKLTAAFAKLDLKGGCGTTADGASRDADVDAFANALDAAVGHGAPIENGKCDAAKTKVVGKYVAAVMGCYSKAAAKLPGTVSNGVDGCTGKALTKVQAAIAKAELKPPCTTTSNAAALVSSADVFVDDQACALAAPGNPGCGPAATPTPNPTVTPTPGGACGNGINDPGEACDASAPSAGWGSCGSDFTCTSCNCDCPSLVTFSGDATAPESILDTGWTGISHRSPVISNGDVSIGLNCAASSRPCGSCPVVGPVANPDAGSGQLDNQRCSHDSSIKCTVDATCGLGNTCEWYFGAPLPLAAGGVTTCVYNQFNGPVTGVANVESGEATTTALLSATVYNGLLLDTPCPTCSDAGGINDGVNGGTCVGGTRNGLACDANGFVPDRPDYGRTSLDCPMASGGIIATLPINLSNETNPVTKTLTAASPNCGPAAVGQKCMCQTCNNGAATPCFTNADCTAVGATICGGNRCIGGTNTGAACSSSTSCPGGSCGRAGEPTKPSACLDDTTMVDNNLDCVDFDSDGEGECTSGPLTSACSVASGHAQRGCLNDGDCGGGPGSCESTNRLCFLTGGGSFQPPVAGLIGTDTLIAVGMEDTPVRDVSNPVLGSVFCVGPTGAPAVNNVAGLPGPGRVTLTGTAVGHP
jgi:hypothetical protein